MPANRMIGPAIVGPVTNPSWRAELLSVSADENCSGGTSDGNSEEPDGFSKDDPIDTTTTRP